MWGQILNRYCKKSIKRTKNHFSLYFYPDFILSRGILGRREGITRRPYFGMIIWLHIWGGERGLFSGGCIYEGCINNEILHYIS